MDGEHELRYLRGVASSEPMKFGIRFPVVRKHAAMTTSAKAVSNARNVQQARCAQGQVASPMVALASEYVCREPWTHARGRFVLHARPDCTNSHIEQDTKTSLCEQLVPPSQNTIVQDRDRLLL